MHFHHNQTASTSLQIRNIPYILLTKEITIDKPLPLPEELVNFDLDEQTVTLKLEINLEQLAVVGKITIYP